MRSFFTLYFSYYQGAIQYCSVKSQNFLVEWEVKSQKSEVRSQKSEVKSHPKSSTTNPKISLSEQYWGAIAIIKTKLRCLSHSEY